MLALCTVSRSATGRVSSAFRTARTVLSNASVAVPSPSVDRMETVTQAGDGLMARASRTRPLALRAKYSYAPDGPATLRPSYARCARSLSEVSLSITASVVSVAGVITVRFVFILPARLSGLSLNRGLTCRRVRPR